MSSDAMLRAVFFDAAGTLFEPREPVGETYARIARSYGVEASAAQVSAAFRRVFHEAPGLAFGPGHPAAALRRMERQWWRDLVGATFAGLGTFNDFEAYFTALFDYFADPANWVADPEAAPMLTRLRERGLTLGVISNFDYRLIPILEGLGLSQFFDSVTISSEAGYAKPAPEIFQIALARHSVIPAQALHIGDSAHLDVVGATAAGLAAALIDHDARERVTVSGRSARIATLAAVTEAATRIRFD
jgi:putative hydrolase of the HAD superfamily